MLFHPTHVQAMWDTWMFHREEQWYLYYLVTERGLGEGVGLATSPDGVAWEDRGVVLRQSKGALWLGTGSVWKRPDPAASHPFLCNFSEWRGRNQVICFAQSKDLLSWERLGPEFDFRIDERWYQATPRRWSWWFATHTMASMYLAMAFGISRRWDSIHAVPKAGGGFWGYWTATPKGRPGFGFGQSPDGLRWEALPPPEIDWGTLPPPPDVELGAVEPIDGVWYALVGSVRNRGMLVLSSPSPQGPFRLQDSHSAFLASGSLRLHTYYTRFFASPVGPLVHHQSITRRFTRHLRPVALMAPVKRALVNADGLLQLGWWEQNQLLQQAEIALPDPTQHQGQNAAAVLPSKPTPRVILPSFDMAKGVVVTGRILAPEGVSSADAADGAFAPEVRILIGGKRGRYLCCSLDSQGVATLSKAKGLGRPGRSLERWDRQLAAKRSRDFRLLVRRDLMELYVDGILVQCFSLTTHGGTTLALMELGGMKATDMRAFEMRT